MRILFTIVLVFQTNFIFSQDTNLKVELETAFCNSDLEKERECSSNWYAANMNNSFYETDTIEFYNSRSYFSVRKKSVCNYVVWNFFSKDSFKDYEFSGCEEPTMISIKTKENLFGKTKPITQKSKLRFLDKLNGLLIQINYPDKKPETFRVVNFEKSKLDFDSFRSTEIIKLTLVRKRMKLIF